MDISDKINSNISSYPDWRGDLLKQLRSLINKTAPELNEDFKWGVPVWTHKGLVCAISGFKGHVKMNFFKGAFISDSKGLFNSGLDSKEHRSINFSETDKLNAEALSDLIKTAVEYDEK